MNDDNETGANAAGPSHEQKHHLIAKFGHAFRGIKEAIAIDNSFKYHFAAAILAIAVGCVLHISEAEWIAITIVIAMVLVAEMFNTVCEVMMRMYTDEYHELVKKLLDISAGAVLFASAAALIVGIIIFGNNIGNLLEYFR
jgi:diacylglycerol kinase